MQIRTFAKTLGLVAALAGLAGCWLPPPGYSERGIDGITLTTAANAPRDPSQAAELRMRVQPGTSQTAALRAFMLYARDLGANGLSNVKAELVRASKGEHTVCRVSFSAESDVHTTLSVVSTRIPEGHPSGGYVMTNKQVCGIELATVWRHETVYRDEYNYTTRRNERRSHLEYKPRTESKYECKMRSVQEWSSEGGYRTPPRTEHTVVTTQVTDWSLGTSDRACGPAYPDAVGVIYGRAYFVKSIPNEALLSASIELPTRVDCRPCERAAIWRVTCAGWTPYGATTTADASEKVTSPQDEQVVIKLGTMNDADSGEARLMALTGRPVSFLLKDGTIVAGTLARVRAWKCQVQLPDGQSQTVDLLEATEATVVGPPPSKTHATTAAPALDCATPPYGECPSICPAPQTKTAATTAQTPDAAAEGPADEAPPDEAPIARTTFVLDDLDAMQDTESELRRHIGGPATVLMRSGESFFGTLSRVHAAIVTIRTEDGQSLYLKLAEVLEVRLGEADPP